MTNKSKLVRKLSLPLLVFYGIGEILGGGIDVLLGKVAAVSGFYVFISFILALLFASFSAFSYFFIMTFGKKSLII